MDETSREFEELLDCVATFHEAELPYMVVGALAVSVHGRPRSIHGIDIVLHMPFEDRDEVRPIVEELGDGTVEEQQDPQWGKSRRGGWEGPAVRERPSPGQGTEDID